MTLCTVRDCDQPQGAACTYAACPGRTYKACSALPSPVRAKGVGESPRSDAHHVQTVSHAPAHSGEAA